MSSLLECQYFLPDPLKDNRKVSYAPSHDGGNIAGNTQLTTEAGGHHSSDERLSSWSAVSSS